MSRGRSSVTLYNCFFDGLERCGERGGEIEGGEGGGRYGSVTL